ncbi:MAG: hypothetical protein MZU95_01110 [Desulfomicrobium escambiense]|nr:hypothetical protein [Desulfomicrobium escambiense]
MLIESACFEPGECAQDVQETRDCRHGRLAALRARRGPGQGTVAGGQPGRRADGGGRQAVRVVGGVIDAHPRPWSRRPPSRLRACAALQRAMLGMPVGIPENQPGCSPRSDFAGGIRAPERDALACDGALVPVWTSRRPEDLVEEVARLSGFDTIPTTFPRRAGRGAAARPARLDPAPAAEDRAHGFRLHGGHHLQLRRHGRSC